MGRNVIDLVLLAIVLAGGVLAWQAGRERARLAAHHDRLIAAAGELPVDDPTLVYLKALDTGIVTDRHPRGSSWPLSPGFP